MRHGYTNTTERVPSGVRKTYDGPDATKRAQAEYLALTHLAGIMPVPHVIERDADGALVTEFVHGAHGQDQIDAGNASEVLHECGKLLRTLHELDPRLIGGSPGSGVICHGDFGPNNVLLDPATGATAALLDWEFSDVGDAIIDVAWCEWIVRMHHPAAVTSLDAFFSAYAERPPWEMRQRAMLDRCEWLEDFCLRRDAPAGVQAWQDRAQSTATWTE